MKNIKDMIVERDDVYDAKSEEIIHELSEILFCIIDTINADDEHVEWTSVQVVEELLFLHCIISVDRNQDMLKQYENEELSKIITVLIDEDSEMTKYALSIGIPLDILHDINLIKNYLETCHATVQNHYTAVDDYTDILDESSNNIPKKRILH